MSTNSQTLFTEIFPVNIESLPKLFIYRINVSGGEYSTIGGKLAYRLKRTFSGNWAWAGGRIIGDSHLADSEIMKVVETLWSEQPNIFRGLRSVTEDNSWQITPQAIADYTARGLLSDIEAKIRNILQAKKQDLGRAVVERVYEIRGWDVRGTPAVSISISSRLVLKEELKSYSARVPSQDLIGLQVADKTSTLKGEIVEIVGPLSGERTRLLTFTQREEMQKIIIDAPDNELVVSVNTWGQNEYDYAVSALRIILRMEYLRQFNVNPQSALKALRIEPDQRSKIVADVAKIAKDSSFIGGSYNTQSHPQLFKTNPFLSQVKFAGGVTRNYDERTLLNDLQRNGVYKIAPQFQSGNPIRVGIINGLDQNTPDQYWGQIVSKLKAVHFNSEVVATVRISDGTRIELENAIHHLQGSEPDIIVAFFPDGFTDEDDDETAYHHFKSLTIGGGIPSQVIEESTLTQDFAIGNIVLGILGKTGNIPYVLAKPLDFADVIVGIDIAREKKKRLSGSINATAIARIYLSDGEFMQYVIHDAPLEGETIPSSVMQSLFPSKEFSGKRVVIHRDGYFRGDERDALKSWSQKINAQFHLVEIIKSGAPRIYARQDKQTLQPQKGSAFLISDMEAILVSSLPPFKNATPMPLRIRTEAPFDIQKAIESVLSITTLHYGSLRLPRLPVTIHYSDKIAYLALRGIKPKNLQGNIPFWL